MAMSAEDRENRFVLSSEQSPSVSFPALSRNRVGSQLSSIGAVGAEPSVCIAFDPGGTTGWSVFGFSPSVFSGSGGGALMDGLEFWSAGQFVGKENVQVAAMSALCAAWPSAVIVIEDFVLRQMNMDRSLLSPVRITAGLSYALSLEGRGWHAQQPSLAMGALPDDRLKRLGLFSPVRSAQHARDAVRHAVTWCRREKTLRESS
jgi:hypothetical protein